MNRKHTPIYSGLLMYFPDACRAVAQCSFIANEQHNPGTPMHWDRSKSGDELDALARHLLEAGTIDDDGIRHSTKICWRSLSNLQKELELAGEATTEYNIGTHFSYDEWKKVGALVKSWGDTEVQPITPLAGRALANLQKELEAVENKETQPDSMLESENEEKENSL